MKKIIDIYEDAFNKFGDSHRSVLWPKGHQAERFHALSKNIIEQEFSVLDFGCGLAHLKPFLETRFSRVSYSGAEISPIFIKKCREKYPTSKFYELGDPDNLDNTFDYVLSSGAFNILYVPDPSKHRDIVFKYLLSLFKKTRTYLAVNFMTDVVDFRQTDAYHQNLIELYSFVFNEMSHRLIVDQSYMPYEFTITVWKDQQVLRPENVYS